MTMKTISIINLKGGVAKTVSAINIAYTLVVKHEKRVLLIDNDKQGNTSKFFGLYDPESDGLSELLTVRGLDVDSVIRKTGYEGLDIITANMNLLRANKEILMDVSLPQQTRLRKKLEQVKERYDYVIIDNAPDLNMSVVNALVASDDVLIPIKIDQFSFDGLEQILEQIDYVSEFNSDIRFAGCFVTMYQRNNVNQQGAELLEQQGFPMFNTRIRKTVKVDEMTFTGKPLLVYAKRSTACVDYIALVNEYLGL
ncbi:ParA family protein [Lysinibacillus fusiformis]|uniref:Chromosome partitioning protein n=1 Tax=Lysinibacillus fusiformis TaxID=28031 RepID=A0A1H9HDJ9_9BACI|nr:ParA family protein [Lysinibacillus fusiformis]SCY30834.1 chromosome partitioning protein [Lysinibacillus fusiformis]SEN52487.1 chromosome partitioning protein [Lysinibacillus fusiformis]SEQ60455.1 chromosome partitioning protein [Lysinibacillus fusiformis]